MDEIVERALRNEEDDDAGTPPGEVRDVRVAVVGVGAAGIARLPGIGRRLGGESFVGQVPDDIDPFGVDLPDEESPTADSDWDWEPAGWHTVERLDRIHWRDELSLPTAEVDRLRHFGGQRLEGYDTLVLAVDGTDEAAVKVATDLAASFVGGPNPTFAVPTVRASDPPPRLLAAEEGTGPDQRAPFGPEAVVPVEHDRATELAPGTDEGSLPARGAERDPVERAAEAVTAALAEALATRQQFGTLADDLHHLRGRAVPHVGRHTEPDGRLDSRGVVDAALATPLADPPAGWTDGGAWLSHLRTPSASDARTEAVGLHVRGTLADRTGVADGARPAGLESYRLAAGGPHELFLFRFERPDDPESSIDDPGAERVPVEDALGPSESDRDAWCEDRPKAVEYEPVPEFEAAEGKASGAAETADEFDVADAFDATDEFETSDGEAGSGDDGSDGGLDVVR